MITVPDDPNMSMDPFLEVFSVPAVYVAPDGTKKDVRVIYNAPYVPFEFADGVVIQNESPMAIGAAVDFSDVRDSGSTATLKIGASTFYVVEIAGGVTGEVMLTLSEFSHGSPPGD